LKKNNFNFCAFIVRVFIETKQVRKKKIKLKQKEATKNKKNCLPK